MYTENLVLCTQEIMYGESITSFSNFKGLLNHRKNAGLFIHCGVVANYKSIQTIAISLLFLQNVDFYTKNGRVNFEGFSGLPEQNYEVFFVHYGNLDFFLTTFTHQLHSGCLILANKLEQTLSLLVDLNLNPLVWSVVMQTKLQPLVWN